MKVWPIVRLEGWLNVRLETRDFVMDKRSCENKGRTYGVCLRGKNEGKIGRGSFHYTSACGL